MGLAAFKDFDNCHSLAPPRKSLVKGERFVRHDGTSDLSSKRSFNRADLGKSVTCLRLWLCLIDLNCFIFDHQSDVSFDKISLEQAKLQNSGTHTFHFTFTLSLAICFPWIPLTLDGYLSCP
jgi:hypothetical protein